MNDAKLIDVVKREMKHREICSLDDYCSSKGSSINCCENCRLFISTPQTDPCGWCAFISLKGKINTGITFTCKHFTNRRK